MKKLLHAYLEGLVQGVGMRAYVQRQAQELGLCGYVKNLPDGRVEVVCEGEEQKLNELYERLQNSKTGRVDKIDDFWKEAEDKYESFQIEL